MVVCVFTSFIFIVQDVTKLTTRNNELKRQLAQLSAAKEQLMAAIKQHFQQCEPQVKPDDREMEKRASCQAKTSIYMSHHPHHGTV